MLPYMAGPEPGRLITRLPSLKVVQTLTAGVDDVRPLVPEGVVLCNARGVHDASTAELAVALVLASQRGIPDFVRDAQHGRWAGDLRQSLADRTVLVVGYGSVGKAVEARLAPFECDRPAGRTARAGRDRGVRGAARPAARGRRRRADGADDGRDARDGRRGVPCRDERRRAARQRVTRCRRGHRRPARRGVDRPAAGGHGRDRPRAAAARPPVVVLCPNVLVSPHVGGNTSAFLPRALQLVVDQLRRYVAGQPLRNVISADY